MEGQDTLGDMSLPPRILACVDAAVIVFGMVALQQESALNSRRSTAWSPPDNR